MHVSLCLDAGFRLALVLLTRVAPPDDGSTTQIAGTRFVGIPTHRLQRLRGLSNSKYLLLIVYRASSLLVCAAIPRQKRASCIPLHSHSDFLYSSHFSSYKSTGKTKLEDRCSSYSSPQSVASSLKTLRAWNKNYIIMKFFVFSALLLLLSSASANARADKTEPIDPGKSKELLRRSLSASQVSLASSASALATQQRQFRSLQDGGVDTSVTSDDLLNAFSLPTSSPSTLSANGNAVASIEWSSTSLITTVNVYARSSDGEWPDTPSYKLALDQGADIYSSLALSADGKSLAISASKKGIVRLFDVPIGSPTDITEIESVEFPSTENGRAIAMSNDGQILAMADPSHNNNAGIIRVYKRGPGGLILVGAPVVGAFSDRLGFNDDGRPGALSLARDYNHLSIAVVAQGGESKGKVYVYKFTGDLENGYNFLSNMFEGQWEQVGTLLGPDDNGEKTLVADLYGSWNDNYIVALGSARTDENGNGGSVQVFKRCSDKWEQIGEDMLTGSKGAGNGRVLQLADSGTKLAVGRDRGLYHVYRLHTFNGPYDEDESVSQEWTLEKEIVVESSDSSNVGGSIDMSAVDNTVLVDVGASLMHLYNVTMGSLPDGYSSWPTCPPLIDDDKDGVPNDADDCPGQGGDVDVDGCPKHRSDPPVFDSDNDGVPDDRDDCPETPAEELPVNSRGCPIDSDNDGIPDLRDRCPNEGGFIHADGCPVDSDNDGIKDCISTISIANCHSTTEITLIDDLQTCCNVQRDFCPDDTPVGATVYQEDTLITKSNGFEENVKSGCPFDTDLDGVFDGLDHCPDTSAGQLQMLQTKKMFVDNQGCAVLSPQMWDADFVDESPSISTKDDGNPHLDLVFIVDANFYQYSTFLNHTDLVDIKIMESSCRWTVDDNLLPGSVVMDEKGSYEGDLAGFTPILIDFDIDADKLVGSELWAQESASVVFCLKFSVLSHSDAEDENNTIEAITDKKLKIAIEFDTEQDFSVIGTDVQRSEADETTEKIDIDYPLDTCRCDDQNECVDSSSPLLQSDPLKVCVRFADDDPTEGVLLPPNYVQMTDIKSFTCRQGSLAIEPIVNFERQGVEGQLTSVKTLNKKLVEGESYTADDRMLTVTSRLPVNFFGPDDLSVECTGTIVYLFTAPGRQRSLHELSVDFVSSEPIGRRRAAEDAKGEANGEGEGESEFSIELLLAKTAVGGTLSLGAIAGAAVGGAALASAFIAAFAVLAGFRPWAIVRRQRLAVVEVDDGKGDTETAEIAEGDTATDALSENSPFCITDGSVA